MWLGDGGRWLPVGLPALLWTGRYLSAAMRVIFTTVQGVGVWSLVCVGICFLELASSRSVLMSYMAEYQGRGRKVRWMRKIRGTRSCRPPGNRGAC